MMINTQPRQNTHQQDTGRQDAAIIRALSSITRQQAEAIAQAVQMAGVGGWTTQTFDDYDGYCSVLVEPNTASMQDIYYFVSGTIQRLDLFEVRDDQLIPLGCFNDAAVLSAKLISCFAEH